MANNKKIVIIKLIVMGVMLGILSPVSAQRSEEDLTPGLQPALALSTVYDDNILRTETNAESDTSLVAAPSLIHRSLFGKHFLELSYFGAFAKFLDFSTEDYNDHDVRADMALDLAPQLSINLAGGYLWSHDARGVSGASLVQSIEPDLWQDGRFQAEVLLGRPASKGRLGLLAATSVREYTNNNQQARDRDRDTLTGTFYYNATAKTTWLLEVSQTDINYIDPGANLDSTESRLMAGVAWEVTGQTTGKVRLGYLNKDLDDTAQKDFSGATVVGDVFWQPQPIDQITLTMERSSNESSQATASYYVTNSITILWRHQLTELFSLNTNVAAQRDDYSDQREDDLSRFGLSVVYDLSDRLDLEGRYEYTARDSNASGAVFDDNVVMLTLVMKAG